MTSEARALIVRWDPDWSINDTPGPLIGWCCLQTDLINSSSDDNFVSADARHKRWPSLIRKSPNHLILLLSTIYHSLVLILNIYPHSWHETGILHYALCTIIQWFILWGREVSGPHCTQSHQLQALICAWLSSSLFIIFHGTIRQMELIVSAHFQKLNLDF